MQCLRYISQFEISPRSHPSFLYIYSKFNTFSCQNTPFFKHELTFLDSLFCGRHIWMFRETMADIIYLFIISHTRSVFFTVCLTGTFFNVVFSALVLRLWGMSWNWIAALVVKKYSVRSSSSIQAYNAAISTWVLTAKWQFVVCCVLRASGHTDTFCVCPRKVNKKSKEKRLAWRGRRVIIADRF